MITDCHSHSLRKNAIVSVTPHEELHSGYSYSTGIHPWESEKDFDMQYLEIIITDPHILAVGETGLDKLRGAQLKHQIPLFEKHIELSERHCKPLIIHCVKAYQQLIEIKKHMSPQQPWIIHGFRQNPQVAEMLLGNGIYLSIGEHFNEESVKIIPADRLLIETDMSRLNIESIASMVARTRETDFQQILDTCASNIDYICNNKNIKSS